MRKTAFVITQGLLLLTLVLYGFIPATGVRAEEGVWAEIKAASLNVREGPGVSFPAIGVLSAGTRAEVLGVFPETGWLQIAYADGPDGKGWVSGADDYVDVQDSLDDVPHIVDVPASSEKSTSTSQTEVDMPEADAEVATDSGSGGKLVFQTSSGGEIYIVNADGTGLRKLTTGLDPVLSPDGTQVAFARWEGIPRGLFVINADGTDERLVYGWDRAGLKSPTWSPDGQRLAFTIETGDSSQDKAFIHVEKPPGAPPGSGKILVWEGPTHPWWKIATVGEDGEDYLQLMGHDYAFSPSWATTEGDPRIAYSSSRGLFITGEEEGMGNTQDDQKYWRLTGYNGDRSPAWSPDGHRIAFQTKSHDHWEIAVINDDGQGRTQITRSWPLADVPVNSVAPAWSPDGEWIVYLSDERGEWELWRIRPDGSEKQLFLEETLDGITFDYQSVDERVVSWSM